MEVWQLVTYKALFFYFKLVSFYDKDVFIKNRLIQLQYGQLYIL